MKIAVRIVAVLLMIFFLVPAFWYFNHDDVWEGVGQLGALFGVIFLWTTYEERHR